MEFRLAFSAPDDGHAFKVWVEPEGMYYELPGTSAVVLSFRGPEAMLAEITHEPGNLVIWRPADTEVWAQVDGEEAYQIAGWSGIPAPGLDSAGPPVSMPGRSMIERLFHRPRG